MRARIKAIREAIKERCLKDVIFLMLFVINVFEEDGRTYVEFNIYNPILWVICIVSFIVTSVEDFIEAIRRLNDL